MRKKRLIAFAAFLLLLITISFFFFRPAPGLQIVGSISAKDLAEVKSFARHQIWSGVFPDFSWKSIKMLPKAVNSRLHTRLVRIEAGTNDTVEILFGTKDWPGGD